MPYRLDIPGSATDRKLRAIEMVAARIPAGGQMVETGSGFGRTAHAWASSCDPSVTVHCVDCWREAEAGDDEDASPPSLARFEAFTSGCSNIVPHRGRSPGDFADWTVPLDLYFENAETSDPALSANLDFWGARVSESGILCGGGCDPARPDIRASAERIAARTGRSLAVVGSFWCLLPDDALLPGASDLRSRLDALDGEGDGHGAEGSGAFRLAPAGPVSSLPRTDRAVLDLVFSAGHAAPWPADDPRPPRLRATARRTGEEAAEPAAIGEVAIGTGPFAPGDQQRLAITLDLSGFTAGPVDLAVALHGPDGIVVARMAIEAVELKDPPVALGDFSSRKTPAPPAATAVRADDVVHAYRWILGREPERLSVVEAHMGASRNDPRRLRMLLLKSAEFAQHLAEAGLGGPRASGALAEIAPFEPDRTAERPIVFLHLPKTGGTTVHYHLLEGRPPRRVCEQRHNDVLTAPALNLADRDLVSGHYDARVLRLVPDPLLLTVIREPGRRLYSVYKYLRLTAPERHTGDGGDLAELARGAGFEAFLKEAARHNPGTVDNSYVRAYGGALPEARWERAAEAEWIARHGAPAEEDWQQMLDRAVALLSRPTTRILSFSNLAAEIRGFLSEIGTPLTEPVRNLKDTRSINEDTVGFRPVEIEPYAPNPTLEHLVRHDRRLLARLDKTV